LGYRREDDLGENKYIIFKLTARREIGWGFRDWIQMTEDRG
jgi:hypothetical protein